jgi:hypothetical protein
MGWPVVWSRKWKVTGMAALQTGCHPTEKHKKRTHFVRISRGGNMKRILPGRLGLGERFLFRARGGQQESKKEFLAAENAKKAATVGAPLIFVADPLWVRSH